jgi:hypothetical protein
MAIALRRDRSGSPSFLHGRALGNEPAPCLAFQVVAARDENPGAGMGLESFAGELVEHVVRDYDCGLADQAELAHVGHADYHFGGLPGTDLVSEQHGGLADQLGHGRDLVRTGPEGGRQARLRQLA